MTGKMIGFIGIEKYEIIHYLSRILIHLKKKVLLADQSKDGALTCSIPVLHTGIREIMDYHGVDVCAGLSMEALEWVEYDYVLADFGFQLQHPMLPFCKEVYLVSDLQLHNIRNLSTLQLEQHQQRFLIVKTMYGNRINPGYIYQEMTPLMIREENSYSLSLEQRDYEGCLQCQYEHQISLRKITKGMKRLIYEILLVDFSRKEIDYAFHLAERSS